MSRIGDFLNRWLWVLALLGMVLGVWLILAEHGKAQEMQPAYVLDHPIDPNLLILATQDGRYPFSIIAGPDCGWVHSDMNVSVDEAQHALWQLEDGANLCYIAVGNQVDPTPCFANDAGACDINAGEHYWPD